MIGPFEAFTFIISDLTRNIRRIKTEEMAKWNLKSQHVSYIYYLYLRGPLTAKELCDISGDDKANASRSIEYLEENGYLRRTESVGKRYRKHFDLTEKGRSVGEDIFARIELILKKAKCGLSEEDSEIMYKSLNLINDNLKSVIEEYKD